MNKFISNDEIVRKFVMWECDRIVNDLNPTILKTDELSVHIGKECIEDIHNAFENSFYNEEGCKYASYNVVNIPNDILSFGEKSFQKLCVRVEETFSVSAFVITNETNIEYIKNESLVETFYHIPFIVCYNCTEYVMLKVLLKFGGIANIVNVQE